MSEKTGKLVVISAPSGTGKGTVIGQLLRLRPEFVFSVSATTRTPRPGEEDGVDYFFIDHDNFHEMISNDEFLEYAEYVGNFYGTPVKPVNENIKAGKTVVLDIEVQGAKQVMQKRPEAITVFLIPPSLEELEKRLRGRGTDSEAKVIARLERAREELEEQYSYKHVVVNDWYKRAAKEILGILMK